MTNWVPSEYDAEKFTFKHEGWEVIIWGPRWNNKVDVFPPHADENVEVMPEGIWVKGEDSSGWHSSASAFIIPWPVIAAIIEARAIVAEREKVSE